MFKSNTTVCTTQLHQWTYNFKNFCKEAIKKFNGSLKKNNLILSKRTFFGS